MGMTKVVGMIFAGITVACVVLLVMLLLIKVVWAWTVPDLFPGAVEQGLVAESVSWLTAGKIAIVIAVLSGIAGGHRRGKGKG